MALCSGCGPTYRTVRIAHNGGDAPPFTEKNSANMIALDKVGVGDTLALVHGNVDRLLKSNEVQINLMEVGKTADSKSGSSKSSRKGKGESEKKSKSQRKADNDEDKKSKSEHKAERNSEGTGKNSAKNAEGPSKSESKKPHTQLYFTKYVRLSNQTELPTHDKKLKYSVDIRNDKGPSSVIFSLEIANYGDAEFHGAISIFDRLPEGFEFQLTRSVLDRSHNSTKAALAIIPFIGLITNSLLPDYYDSPLQPNNIGLSDQSKGSLVHYELPELKLQPKQHIIFDFLVNITNW
jgi:hypothetical protein